VHAAGHEFGAFRIGPVVGLDQLDATTEVTTSIAGKWSMATNRRDRGIGKPADAVASPAPLL